MMLRNVMVLLIAVSLASCGAKKNVATTENTTVATEIKEVETGTNPTIAYKSLGNGVASIQLELFENDLFIFELTSIPQPEDGGDAIKISEKGTFISEGNLKTLKFRNPKFSLSALFDATYGGSNEFKVIDDRTVRINTDKKTIMIWGVACERL